MEEPREPEIKPEPKSHPMPQLDDALLKHICSCESGDGQGSVNHYEADGVTPLVGRSTPARLGQDIGMCQINTMYHQDTAESLGYDIYTPEGNWGYAKHLLETQGTQPWYPSEHCWSKYVNYND